MIILGTWQVVSNLFPVKRVGPVPPVVIGLNLESGEDLDRSIWGSILVPSSYDTTFPNNQTSHSTTPHLRLSLIVCAV